MNKKANKKQSGHSHALCRHKHFKGDCNDAPRKTAKKEIIKELAEESATPLKDHPLKDEVMSKIADGSITFS